MTRPRSKTLATWLALAGGALGLHRFYLHGLQDKTGWLFPLPTLVGAVGAVRMHNLGQDDAISWLLIPVLGLMLSIGALSAIVIGLTPDDRWAARFGADPAQPKATAWGPVLGVVAALLLGGTVLMGTIAFGGQKYFEWQRLQAEQAAAH